MKTIATLNKLIHIYYYLLLIIFVITVAVLPILFGLGKIKSLDLNGEYDVANLSLPQFAMIIFFNATIFILFLKAIFLLKNTLTDLTNGNFFTELVIQNFKKIGKLILITGISYSVLNFILRIIILNDIKLGINNSLIVSILIGLFFMFLSEVFAKARKTKQENDLTI
ncbi:DUF2975 domain-containing protein [Polaribacter sp. M15]